MDSALLKDDLMLQCTRYALEMMSYSAVWSHVIAALITDDEIQLHYYCHSIILMLEPLNFLDNPTKFVAMLYTMSKLSQLQWGYAMLPAPTSIQNNLLLTITNALIMVPVVIPGEPSYIPACRLDCIPEIRVFIAQLHPRPHLPAIVLVINVRC